jgi:hypothetical protein
MISLVITYLYKKLNDKFASNKLGSFIKAKHLSMELQPVVNRVSPVAAALSRK